MAPVEYAITVDLCVSIRGPVQAGPYEMDDVLVHVSYPSVLTVPVFQRPWTPPPGASTYLIATWREAFALDEEATAKHLTSPACPALFKALRYANQLFAAHKLVELNHLSTQTIRTLGEMDVLYHLVSLNDKRLNPKVSSAIAFQWGNNDYSIPMAAREHISGDTKPISRRVIRCFELADHGYYTEALIVAFALLDDLVQERLRALLAARGLIDDEGTELLRSIEKERLRKYLGMLLKLLSGKTLADLWPESSKAMKWLNKRRNDMSHAGGNGTRADAYIAIYVVLRCLKALEGHGIIKLDFSKKMLNYAQFHAFHQADAVPDWITEPATIGDEEG